LAVKQGGKILKVFLHRNETAPGGVSGVVRRVFIRVHLFSILASCLTAFELRAQQIDQALEPRAVRAERLGPDESVRLDGVPDEIVWQRAPPAIDFLQREPSTGDPASERTEIRVVYDDNRLIFGVVLHDSEPGAILNNQMQRDESLDTDDSFAWVIDSFLDGRTGYFFEINPAGAVGDGLVTPAGSGFDGGGGGGGGGGDINRSWDGIWHARVGRTSTGWTAEIEIPFRTLNFDPDLAEWGINFRRIVRRKNEESLWSGHALNQGLTRLVNAGRMNGLQGISQGIGLDLKPYTVGHVSSAPGFDMPRPRTDGAAGLDVFYNLTPALRLNVSVNTDFAETEVDERRVNLTRFPLFFEEKRDFFLEGSSYFDFGRVPQETIVPFFSRQIGRDVRGRAQRIDFGTKLTGRAGAFDIGVLQVRTAGDEAEEQLGEDFTVARLRRRMFQQSYIGALYTRRATRLPDSGDRHTVGLDLGLSTSRFRGDRNLDFSAFYLWNNDPDNAAARSGAFGALLSYPNEPWTATMYALELQPGYDPAVGFVRRRGYRQYSPALEWSPRLANHRWVRGLEFSVEADIQADLDNRILTRELELTLLQLNAHDGGRYQFVVTPQYERLDENFEISEGVLLPAGSAYRFTRYQVEVETAEHRIVSVSPEIAWGDFFSGTRRDFSMQLEVRPRRGLELGLEAERNVLDLAEGSFTADVFRLDASGQFSPFVALAANLQYDTVSRSLGWQVRFRWIRRPGNDFYLVYTHNWQETFGLPRRRFETIDNRLATKLVYTIRF
jgi:hypothetical protein